MKILITNIGNRNIKYKEKLYSDLELKEDRVESELSFRDWTKQLLDRYEVEKENIKLNILDTVLNRPDFKPEKVFIVVSDQADTKYKGQDTLYEGEIIQKILLERFKIKDVELKYITDEVTNENHMMQFYQQFYLELLQKYPDAKLIFCDAGGTGQQKTASKLIAEFMLPDDQWIILYPKKDGSVEEKNQIEYRNIINKEQAISLVRKSQYESALSVLGRELTASGKSGSFLLLTFAHFRIRVVIQQTKKIYDNNKLPERKKPLITSACSPTRTHQNERLINILSEQAYLILSEQLRVAYHYCLIDNFRDSVLAFAVFYEAFIDECLRAFDREIRKMFVGKKFRKVGRLTDAYLKSNETLFPETVNYAMENTGDYDKIPDYTSVPFAIHLIAEQNCFPEFWELAKILTPHLDFSKPDYNQDRKEENSIRSIRNKLAHEGVYIDKTEMAIRSPQYKNLLENCLKAMGLQVEDVYAQMNQLIEAQIRKMK